MNPVITEGRIEAFKRWQKPRSFPFELADSYLELAKENERLKAGLWEVLSLCGEFSASNWYVAQGDIAKAAQHALTPPDIAGVIAAHNLGNEAKENT